MKYAKLKQGQAFQFNKDGDVYVRCRGGYRHGSGGPLIKFNYPDCPVMPFFLGTLEHMEAA